MEALRQKIYRTLHFPIHMTSGKGKEAEGLEGFAKSSETRHKQQFGRWARLPKLAGVLACSVMPNFCDPMDSSLPGSSVHRSLQARVLEWLTISPFMGSSQSRNQTHISCVSCIGRWILYHWRFYYAMAVLLDLVLIASHSVSEESQHLYRSHHCPQHTPFHKVSLYETSPLKPYASGIWHFPGHGQGEQNEIHSNRR